MPVTISADTRPPVTAARYGESVDASEPQGRNDAQPQTGEDVGDGPILGEHSAGSEHPGQVRTPEGPEDKRTSIQRALAPYHFARTGPAPSPPEGAGSTAAG